MRPQATADAVVYSGEAASDLTRLGVVGQGWCLRDDRLACISGTGVHPCQRAALATASRLAVLQRDGVARRVPTVAVAVLAVCAVVSMVLAALAERRRRAGATALRWLGSILAVFAAAFYAIPASLLVS